jgi:O-methyltransferase/aklanonic acid methyltransferase
MDIWSKHVSAPGAGRALDYWQYFGLRFVELAAISPGTRVLDVGCGDGSSLFPAAERTGPRGRAVGIDICPH